MKKKWYRNIIDHFVRKYMSASNQIKVEAILNKYIFSFKRRDAEKCVVFNMDSDIYPCGFADKLKGVITSFAYAKAKNLPFYIEHKSPFDFSDFFKPNKYNWIAPQNTVSYDLGAVSIMSMIDSKASTTPLERTYAKQIHVFANIDCLEVINAHYKTNYVFSDLFHELFSFSGELKLQLDKIKKELGENYISVSFRFINLLGDFKEYNRPELNGNDKEKLIAKACKFVEDLKQKHPEVSKILVTADSKRFLDSVAILDYVYLIPGEIGHSGTQRNENAMMKTLLDFFAIANAKHAYLGKSGDMYASQFAKMAAYTNNTPFEMIEF